MAEFAYDEVEAWHTTVKLATAVGRLKVGSNLKASGDAQQRAFEQAGLAGAMVAEGASREGGSQIGLYRDARGALAQCRAWLHILASLMNEPDSIFGNELDLAETASRQLSGMLRTLDRPAPSFGGGGPGGPGGGGRPMGPPNRGPGGGGPRYGGPR